MGRLLSSSPGGKKLRWVLHRLKQGAKAVVIPTMFWEQLGFTCFGPVDGHNIAELETTLKQVKDYRHKPAFVHVVTSKGKGYNAAEVAPAQFHSVPPKNKASGTAPTYSEVFPHSS
jgi:1-deoxy-D-xylulose-5-phosphate synthase